MSQLPSAVQIYLGSFKEKQCGFLMFGKCRGLLLPRYLGPEISF